MPTSSAEAKSDALGGEKRLAENYFRKEKVLKFDLEKDGKIDTSKK